MEWNTPVGEAGACGGDAMMRADAFRAAGGYDPTLIAGEDPELCLRIRRAGFTIVRLAAEMTLHDAAIHEARQWWRRSVRAGHAFAESAYLHGTGPERYRVRELRSILFWGGVVPATSVGLAPITLGASLGLGATGYALLWSRVFARRSQKDSPRDAALYATAVTVGKLAEMRGAAEFAWNRFVKREKTQLIEYKGPTPAHPDAGASPENANRHATARGGDVTSPSPRRRGNGSSNGG